MTSMSRYWGRNSDIRTQGLSRGVLRVAGAESTANGSALAGFAVSSLPTRRQRHPSARRKAQGPKCCMSASFVFPTPDCIRHLKADSPASAVRWSATRRIAHLSKMSHRRRSRDDWQQMPLLGKLARPVWRCGGCGLVSLVSGLTHGQPKSRNIRSSRR